MRLFSLLAAFGLILGATPAHAVDMSHMFAPDTKTTPAAAEAIRAFFQDNCPDLSWALSVKENAPAHQACGGDVEQVHVVVELSHLSSEFTFWVNDKTANIDWINEQYPAWRLCSYADSMVRDDLSCKSETPALNF